MYFSCVIRFSAKVAHAHKHEVVETVLLNYFLRSEGDALRVLFGFSCPVVRSLVVKGPTLSSNI